MITFFSRVFGYIFKNLAIILGVIEAILKVAAGIISLTPSKRDDAILAVVDKIFSWLKKFLYNVSDNLSGKEPTVPNS